MIVRACSACSSQHVKHPLALEGDGEGEEEERRLFYVAITRARNELYLSYPIIRAGYGAGGDLLQHPSRFLHEIPTMLIEEWNLRSYG